MMSACVVPILDTSESLHGSHESRASLTLRYLLDTLTTCFLHDTQQMFVTKEIFDILLQPLVNQVS